MTDRRNFTELTPGLHIERDATPLESFARSYAYSLLEPLKGALQLVTNEPVTLITPPPKAEIGSQEWVAQQLGYGCGAGVWLLSLQKANSFMLRNASLGSAEGLNVLSRVKASGIGVAALSGFEYGFLQPITNRQTEWSDRIRSGVVEATTWTAMVSAYRGLGATSFGKSTAASETLAQKQLRYLERP